MVMNMIMGILGICGRMGNKIYDMYKDTFDIIGIDLKQHQDVLTYANLEKINELDVLVDFSSSSSKEILLEAMNRKIPILSGTTGYELEEIEELRRYAKSLNTIFFWSCNYAKGILLFEKLIKECSNDFKVFDFVEIHATTKKDKPSGTAKMLANDLGIDEDKIQSLRMFKAPAVHEIVFSSDYEKIIIRHEVIDTKAFIEGFNEMLGSILGGKKC